MASGNTPNREQLYKLAVSTAKKGQRKPARMMFQRLLQEDPRNVSAMLWMARLSPEDERLEWLKRVLKVDAKNKLALQGLQKIEQKDVSARNRVLFRVAIFGYIGVLSLITLAVLVWVTTLPPI